MATATARAENILTPEFRGSFVHLLDFEKDPSTGQLTNRNSVLMLFPKLSADWTADLPWLVANIRDAILGQWPGGVGMPPVLADPTQIAQKAWPVGDGDVPNSNGVVQEAHKGHWVVRTASSNFNPTLNLLNGVTGELGTMTAATCFSGCFFQAQINAYAYTQQTGSGVAMGLNNIKFTREGESLGGGGVDAATAFGVVPTVAPASAAFAPVPVVPGVPAGFPVAPGVPAVPTGASPVPPTPAPSVPVGAPPKDWLSTT